MKYYQSQWLTALAIFSILLTGTLSTACQHHARKPVVVNSAVVNNAAINNAVIHKSPNDDRTYAALMLANNLQVVLVSDPTLENSAASLAVGVGSAQDPEDQQGLAHYLEHMLFLGTEKYPEPDGFVKYTQTNGGMTNAFTSYEKTNYMFQINAGKFDEALDRFSDYFKKPTFDANYSDKERNAVNNEWSLQKAQDAWNIARLDGVTGNQQNPRAKFNIGNLETLSDKPNSVLNEKLKAFYQGYYSANIMRLTLVGKQTLPELKILAEKHFATIANKNVVVPEIIIAGLTDAEKGKSIHYKPIKDIKYLYVDFPIKSNKSQWRLKPNEFVKNLITSEEVGTLGEQMRKKGFATNVTASVSAEVYGADGYFRVQTELTDLGLKNQDEIVAAIFAYVDLVKRDGLNENYFREEQAMSRKDFLNTAKQNPLNQAVQLTMLQFDLPVENLLDAGFVYERFDADIIKGLLDQFDKRKARVWHINNQEQADTLILFFDGKYAIRNISPEEYSQWDALAKKYTFNLPPLNNLFTDQPAPIVDNKYLKPRLVINQAGVEAFVLHSEHYREDKGHLTLEINSTFAQKSAKNIVLSNVLNDIFKKQNLTLMDRAARASLGLTISVSGANSQAIYVSGYTTKHPVLVAELLQNFAHLPFTQQVFEEALVSYKQSLSNSNKDHVFRQLYGQLGRLTNKAQWRKEELLVAAGKVTLADIIAYHKAVKSDPLIRILASGNYTEAAVTEIALSAAKMLPGKRMPNTRMLPHFVTPAAGKIIEFKDSVTLADSAVLHGWFREKKSDDEKAQLAILNALFGNAFFMQLRTNEQLGYVVQSGDYAVDDVPGFFMLVQSSNSDLSKVKTRMDKFRKEYFPSLKAVDVAEIEQVKQSIVANILQKPTDFYKEATQYGGEFWNAKYEFDARDRHVAALKKVTKEDLLTIYESVLLNDKSPSIVLQLRGENFKAAAFASPH